MPRKSALLIIGLMIVSAGIAIAIWPNRRSSLISEGNEIVLLISDYRSKNNRLPNTLAEAGITNALEGPFYYE